MRTAFCCTLLLLTAATGALAEPPKPVAPRPQVWMAPPGANDGRAFRELFTHADQWQETRQMIDVVMYADHVLDKQFSDAQLQAWFAQMREWKLKFALEVGGVKPWGVTGERTFQIQKPKWDRFQRLGANLYAVAMDEPLVATRLHLKKPDDYAVEETANFIALVRKHYPQVLVGDIETYPSLPLDTHYWWLDALEKKLAEKKVRGLDFYRLDVDWANLTIRGKGTWAEVRKLESHCRSRKLPFSLIYWAAGYPALARKGLADDSTWYVGIMQQGYDYAMLDGRPDQYVIESWVGAPAVCVPESQPYSFTRSVLDFTRKFVPKSQ